MKKANFKAILAMLLVGVMGVSMTACSGTEIPPAAERAALRKTAPQLLQAKNCRNR